MQTLTLTPTAQMYQLTSVFLKVADAAVFNMSLLTSDVWAVVASYVIFRAPVSYLYFVAFAIIAGGLVLYNCQPPPGVAAAGQREEGSGSAGSGSGSESESGIGSGDGEGARLSAKEGTANTLTSTNDVCGARAAALFDPARRAFSSLLAPPARDSVAARLSGVASRLLREPRGVGTTMGARRGERYHSHSPALSPLDSEDVLETEIVISLDDDGDGEEEGAKLLS